MKYTLAIMFTLMFGTIIVAQSTERFMRIIGNSTHTYEPSHTRVNYEVSSVEGSTYREQEESSFEDSFIELQKRVDSLNLSLTEKSDFKFNPSRKTKTKEYYIDVTQKSDLDKIVDIQNEKYKIKNFTYIYSDPNIDIEQRLCEEAISDAKQKAKFICDNTNKKLGKILNIETRSNGCCSYLDESSRSSEQRKYSITITFEISDR